MANVNPEITKSNCSDSIHFVLGTKCTNNERHNFTPNIPMTKNADFSKNGYFSIKTTKYLAT